MTEQMYGNTGIRQKVIEEIRGIAIACGVEYVMLFGSRARGDFRERSDIDLAVFGGNTEEFSLEVDENTSTLLKYDIVDMGSSVQQELLESIEREGIFIYEKV